MNIRRLYNFANGLSSEVTILLLALGVGYTFDSLVNALVSYYLLLLGRFLLNIVTTPRFWETDVSSSIGSKQNYLSFHYFVFSVVLACGVVMIPDGYMTITTKIASYFAVVVLYRFIMQTLLLLGFTESKTARYLNGFVLCAFLLPLIVLALILYKGFASYSLPI